MVNKKRQQKRVVLDGVDITDLTKTERLVFKYLSKNLTPKQIIIKRSRAGIKSKEATYKVLRSLKKKGYVGSGYKVNKLTQLFEGGTTQLSKNPIRLHGQQFSINILDCDERYIKFLKTCNSRIIDNNTVMFYRNKIIVYGVQSFYGNTVHECMGKGCSYWNKFICRLENDYNIILIKPRQNNIYFFNQHWAEIRNELAKEYTDDCKHLQITTTDDGKVWLLIDNSFNFHELECIHSKTGIEDITIIKDFFNDLRDNPHLFKPSVIQNLVIGQSKIIEGLLKHNEDQQRKHDEILLMLKTLTMEVSNIKNQRR